MLQRRRAASREGSRTISAKTISSSSRASLAHRQRRARRALETGTVGVVAAGVDVSYPPENEQRQKALYERGLVVAEMPPGTEPRARHFPYRNRIIAGIAGGTVVVEAAPRSGSLITARLAGEPGREVMAVPGSPLDPRAQGCNQLIREGATLVQSAADVVEALRPMQSLVRSEPARYEPIEHMNGDEALGVVEELLGPSPVPVDEIIRLSGPRRARCRWPCSSSTSRAGWSAMPATR